MVADAAPSRVLVVGAGLTGALVSRSLRRLLPASSRVVVWEADANVAGALGRITPTLDRGAFASCDFVVEAVIV